MKRIILLSLSAFLFILTDTVYAQERTVSGRVTSADDDSGLPGVNVVVKGSTVGTVTDTEGNYSISAPSNGTLVYTFIGLTSQEIPINGRSSINVQMVQDVQQLSEVVVTALGIERNKNELAYSAQEVRGDEVTRNRQTNFVNALSGKIAGVDIKAANTMGGSTNVVIRGYSSLLGNNQALFVIDGIPVSNANTNTAAQRAGGSGTDYGNAAADINPDNIASINVLKGAAATALYGSRGMNGVIMITTKKGRRNTFDVTVNSGVTWGTIDKSTFARYQRDYGAGYALSFPGTLTLDDGTLPHVHYQADASFGPRYEGQMVYQWDALDPFHPNYRRATPWVFAENGPDTYYETSVNSNQSVLVSAGTDKATFKLGYTRADEKGILPNSSLDKNLFNFTTTYDVTSKLRFEASANFSNIIGIGRFGTGYAGGNPNQAFRQWWATNVDIKHQREAYFRNRQNITWNWSSTAGTRPIYMDNPYWTRYENYSNDRRNNFFGYIATNYKLNSWLEVIGRVGTNSTDDLQEERIAVGSTALSQYQRFNRSFIETNFDLMLSINRKLSDDFTLRGLIGSNLRRSEMQSIRASTSGGLAVPKLYSLSNSASPLAPPFEELERIGVDGVFVNATLGYKEMLFLDASVRQDRSTTLPTEENTYTYPSVAGSFVFSQLLDVNWLNHAKARVNYAEVGNDAPALSIYNAYAKPTAVGSVPLFSLQNTRNNPELKSERMKSIEAGIDADFFDGRFGFDFTWYKQTTFDQIMPVALTGATGYSSKFVNAGAIENKGIEISVFGVPVRSGDFTWTVNVNFTRNRNMVKELFGEGEQQVTNVPIQAFQGGVSLNAGVGYPYGIIRGTDFIYTNGQRTVNAAGYYMSTPSSANVIGDPNPDWLGGINNRISYKNVSLSFLIDARYGGDIFSLDQFYGDGSGLYEETAGVNNLGNPTRSLVAEGGGVILPGVKQDGSPNDIRASNHNGAGATAFGYVANSGAGMPRAFYVYDGTFVKLREFALTYSLPTSVLSRFGGFKAVDISAVGRNLWIIHKNMKYSDPEESLSAGNANAGYQSGAYPAVRTYGFNVRFTF
jgi:TonB-linked SusC/RagA family outer membrane protein